MTTPPKLALIAGSGDLPIRVAQRCEAEGREVFIIRLKGFADAHLHRWPGQDFGMAEIGKIESFPRLEGRQMVMMVAPK